MAEVQCDRCGKLREEGAFCVCVPDEEVAAFYAATRSQRPDCPGAEPVLVFKVPMLAELAALVTPEMKARWSDRLIEEISADLLPLSS